MKYDFCFRDEARKGTASGTSPTGKHMNLQVSVLMGKGYPAYDSMAQEGF